MDVIKMINEKYDIDEKHSAVIDLPFEFISEFKVTAIVGVS